MTPADHANTVEWAQKFHEAYERLAPEFGYETREESAVPWEQVPENNRALMAAVVEDIGLPALQAQAETAYAADPEEWREYEEIADKLHAAEQRAADMEKALRQIANAEIDDRLDDLIHGSSLRKVARAALYAARVKLKAEA